MLTTRYQKVDTLTVQDVMRMHALFEANYANSPLQTFISDLNKKDGAFIVRHRKTQEIVGFSTLGIYEFELNGRKAKGLFSGDTIVEKQYWGTRSLQRAAITKMVWEAFKNPFKMQYWLLISKGYKTYLLMTRNFHDYYPRRGEHNADMQAMVEQYCEAMFPGKLDRERMVLDFGENANCLMDHVAGITPELRADADIAFFEQRNPGWERGNELPCIARADALACVQIMARFVKKMVFGSGKKRIAEPGREGVRQVA